MTKSDWFKLSDPERVLRFLRHKTSDRKLRLFACDCCRRMWDKLDPLAQTLVEVAEAFADGRAQAAELEAARRATYSLWGSGRALMAGLDPLQFSHAALCVADVPMNDFAGPGGPVVMSVYRAKAARKSLQIQVLQDIFNPFRKARLDPAWLRWNEATIPRLAQQMYDSRDFASMPILADALEEAGCTSADILDHCRGSGPHVRGCWVVDLVLGKE